MGLSETNQDLDEDQQQSSVKFQVSYLNDFNKYEDMKQQFYSSDMQTSKEISAAMTTQRDQSYLNLFPDDTALSNRL